jgi:hypothetical protein
LHIAEHAYENSALGELLGIPPSVVNDARLYRALDHLLPHKDALQKHLKNRLGELFDLKYDLLLYDVTSTYFEGQCEANPLAKRGYSRDQRSDCKQVCIALVVSREGMPIGYELFAGNKADVSSVEQIVTTMEDRYGKSDRIWVMDRGMSSADNIEFLKEGNRRYIIGTPKSMLKKYEHHLLQDDWSKVREGLEVKLCVDPEADPSQPPETFILCRSADRAKKEQAMHHRFEKRIEEGLTRIASACGRQKLDAIKVSHRVGKLLGQNTRAAGAFKTTITTDDKGRAMLQWEKIESWRDWASLSEGCYLLRSNVSDWSAEELWQAYMQLTQAETAFRIHKSDLSLPHLAPETRARRSPHSGLLPRLRAVENPGPVVQPRWSGRRTAQGFGGTGPPPCRRRGLTHPLRPGDPPPLRDATRCPSDDSAGPSETEFAGSIANEANVVKTKSKNRPWRYRKACFNSPSDEVGLTCQTKTTADGTAGRYAQTPNRVSDRRAEAKCQGVASEAVRVETHPENRPIPPFIALTVPVARSNKRGTRIKCVPVCR